MNVEGGEYREDKEEAERQIREVVDEARRRTEARRESEERAEHEAREEEPSEKSEESEFDRKMRETIDEAKERTERRYAESEEDVREMVDEARQRTEARREKNSDDDEGSNDNGGDTERCVRDAVCEIEEEEAERRAVRERYEQELREKEEDRELDRIHREDEADKDRLSEFEEELAERLEEYDIDPEEIKERWRERCVDDIEDELESKSEEDESEEGQKDKEDDQEKGETRTNEGVSYHADSGGQVYAVKFEGREQSGSETEGGQADPELGEEEGAQPSTNVEEPSETAEGTEPAETYEETQRRSKTTEMDMEEEEQSDRQEKGEQNTRESSALPANEHDNDPSTPERELNEEGETPKTQERSASETDEERHSVSRSEIEELGKEPVEETASSQESAEKDGESRGEELGGAWRFKRASIFGDEEKEDTEEDLRRFLREQFHKLPEEEKEEFRELLRSLVKEIEDAERLAYKHGREDLLEGDAREMIEDYLRVQAMREESEDEEPDVEELAEAAGVDPEQVRLWTEEDEMPEELRELLNTEGEWRLREILRVYVQGIYPQSEEELERLLEENPEVREMDNLDWEMKLAKAWIGIVSLRNDGEMDVIVRNGREFYSIEQIHHLSSKYKVDEGQILRWLRWEERPTLIEVLGHRMISARKKGPVTTQHRELDIQEIHRLYFDEGMTMLEVARHLGYKSSSPISRVFKEQGWISRVTAKREVDIDPDEVYRLYFEEGLSLDVIGERFGFDSNTAIRRIFDENGWEPRPVEKQVDVERVYEMYYDEGLTLTEIAPKVGVHTDYLSNLFRQKGWKIEHRLGAKKKRKYGIRLWIPQIDGIEIKSTDELLRYIMGNALGITARDDFPELMERARIHFEIVGRLRDKKHIHFGTVPELAGEFDIPIETARYLLRREGRPRIYYLLDEVSMDDRVDVAREMEKKMNGVFNVGEMDRRLKTLFFYNELVKAPGYREQRRLAVKYFRFWREYFKGAVLSDICETVDIVPTTYDAWTNIARVSRLPAFAACVPLENPRPGWKWLPLKLNTLTNLPERFIQVPERVTSTQDILDVLEQLFPWDSAEMRELDQEYSGEPLHLEFMYLLGLIVSDGGFSHNIEYSANVQFSAAKKYVWASRLGRAFRHAMGRLGFSSSRWANDIRMVLGKMKNCLVWGSETSPLIYWIETVLLGIDISVAKQNQPIDVDWLFQAPSEWTVPFLQGLADGDGCASIKAFCLSIASITNQQLFRRLLKRIGLHSTIDGRSVVIRKQNEIVKASKIPLFRHTTGRLKRLRDLAKMIRLRQKGRPDDSELEIIKSLYRQGYTAGRIVEYLWYNHEIARTLGGMYYWLNKIDSGSI